MEVLQGQRAEHARLRVAAHHSTSRLCPRVSGPGGTVVAPHVPTVSGNQVTGWSPAGEVSAARELDKPTADGNDV